MLEISRIARSFVGVGAMKLVAIPATFGTTVLIARLLGPEEFGRYAFVMALVPLALLPVAGGLPQLLVREVALYKRANEWAYVRGVVASAHVWVVSCCVIGLITYTLAVGPALFSSISDRWQLLSIALTLVPLFALNEVRRGTIKGLGYPAIAEAPTQLLQPLLFLSAVLGLMLAEIMSSMAIILANIIVSSLVLGIATAVSRGVWARESGDGGVAFDTRRWRAALLPFSLIAFLGTMNTQIGIVLLGLLGTDEAVGVMRIGERAAQLVALPLALVNLVIAPSIVNRWRDRNFMGLQRLSTRSARGALFLASPLAIVLIVFGGQIIELAFGQEYSGRGYWPLVILVVGQWVNVEFGSVGVLLMMSGHEKDTVKGQVAALLTNFAVCAMLIPVYGAIGAAIGTAIGTLVWNSSLAWAVHARLGIRPSAL